jgi:hypothetical protein
LDDDVLFLLPPADEESASVIPHFAAGDAKVSKRIRHKRPCERVAKY